MLLALLLLGLTALVGLVGPDPVSRWVTSTFDLSIQGLDEAATHRLDTDLTAAAIEASIDADGVGATLAHFASYRSRIPGYGELGDAARYIRQRFGDAGVTDIRVDTFLVTVPVDVGGSLSVEATDIHFDLHALWPNGVRTPSTPASGLFGSLVDVGAGTLAEMAGKPLEGRIALMGFGSGYAYLDVRSLGAAAIVFCDDGAVSREQAADKFLKIPADIPRYWVDRDAADHLRNLLDEGPVDIRLHSRMEWRQVPAYNVYGWIPGSDEFLPDQSSRRWRDDVVALSAYYDGMSVVPALAPAAEGACSITALLELADFLGQRPPRYTTLLVATSAHFEGLSGINDFLYRHARRSGYFLERMAERFDIRLFISLDLSSGADQVAAFAEGVFYDLWVTNGYVKNIMKPYARRFSGYEEVIFGDGRPRFVDAVAPSKETWKDFMPIGLALEGEAPVFVGLSGLTLATPDDLRPRVDTPLDRLEFVDVPALTRQIRTLAALLGLGLADDSFFGDTELELKDKGHSLGGSVYWFNRDVNFAVPKDPIVDAVVTYAQPGLASLAGVRTLMTTMTDSSGRFRFDVLRNAHTNRVLAYKLDDEGRVAWAPDLGVEGAGAFPVDQKYVWWEDEMVQVLFPCQSLTLLQTVDARQLVALDRAVILGEGDAAPQWYGTDYVVNQSQVQGKAAAAMVVYAKPGTRVKVLLSTGLIGVKYLLTDAPDELVTQPVPVEAADMELLEVAKGRGVPIEAGFIPRALFRGVGDMWALDDVRLKILESYGIRNERVVRLHQRAAEALDAARTALAVFDYAAFTAAVRVAAGLESRAYPDVKATANDTVNGIVFYFVLLLPFAFFGERLLFGFADIRWQLAGFAGIFLAVFAILHMVHPAFKLSSSPYLVLLAFVILAMGSTVVILIVTRFRAEMRMARQRASGIFDVDVGRVSAILAAVLLGISNLRKRKIRTGLTATTLILLSFTALSFTSVSTTIQFYELPRPDPAAYEGALVREANWRGLQPMALEYMRSAFADDALVVPRAWYLLPSPTGRTHIHFANADEPSRRSNAFGVVGLHADEPLVTGADRHLSAGRWFQTGERRVCLLPVHLANLIGIDADGLGDARIRLLGREYAVVGLFDAVGFNDLHDLDGERLTPIDLVNQSAINAKTSNPEATPTAPIRTFEHLDAGNIVLVPVADALEMGGSLRSIAIAQYTGPDLDKAVKDFVTRVVLPIFVGRDGETTVYSSLGAASLSGFGNLVIPLLIATLIILNTMLGSVYERTREIGIFSSLGLTPTHVAALFLAEASVFATVGAVVGYLIGQVLAMGLAATGSLQGLSLNYSSLSAISATLVVMVTVFLSTAYPAKRAADMTVPDVTRRWSFGEPDGDLWSFDFPFTVPGREVAGLYGYLQQIFDSYGEGSIGEFLTEDVRATVHEDELGPRREITLKAWLAPYDLGISQGVRMTAIHTGEHNIYRIEMEIRRHSGDLSSWVRINRGFLNVLRKRFLVWRTLPTDVKDEYALRAEPTGAAHG